jgi:hypothetical protein
VASVWLGDLCGRRRDDTIALFGEKVGARVLAAAATGEKRRRRGLMSIGFTVPAASYKKVNKNKTKSTWPTLCFRLRVGRFAHLTNARE